MKKLLTLVLALATLAVFSGLGVAQQKGVEKSRPTGVEMKPSAAGEKTVDKASPKLMTGKVLEIQAGKTFTVMSNGKVVTFNAAKLKALPKVGEIIDITYTQTPGGPMEAINLNSSKSNIY